MTIWTQFYCSIGVAVEIDTVTDRICISSRKCLSLIHISIIESIFMWDGVGKLAVDSITMRDYPMIQAYVVWMAVIYVLVNLLSDLLYHALDPRIRLGVREE